METIEKPDSIEHSKPGSPERIAFLRKKAASLPERPGVYLHKDAKGKVLYVGKAKVLCNRVRSYFTAVHNHPPKTKALVERVFDFEVMLVDNENESLLLENNLIKNFMPPYNILLRDDKTYPYIKITLEEQWPRLMQTRKRKNDGSVYFGPYANAAEIYKILGVIHRFFPLVKCTPYQFSSVKRPCNYFDVKRCLGPCHMPVEKSFYDKMITQISQILSGKSTEAISLLQTEMMVAVETLEYEKAALIRDQITALNGLSKSQSVSLQPDLNADVIGVCAQQEKLACYISVVRNGRIVASEAKIVAQTAEIFNEELFDTELAIEQSLNVNLKKIKETHLLKSFLSAFYAKREIPDFVCLPSDYRQMFGTETKIFESFLTHLKKQKDAKCSKVVLHFDSKCPNTKNLAEKQTSLLNSSFKAMLEMCFDNAKNEMVSSSEIEEKNLKMLESVRVFLDLKTSPLWMECYDISTFQGSQTVASGVVFKNGKASKSDYRKYIIKEVVGQDDFASLREVMKRRFSDDKRHEIPDLLVIDGGEPQLREVSFVLNNLGLGNIALVGIAKSRTKRSFSSAKVEASVERIVIPRRNNEGQILPADMPKTQFLKMGSPEYRLFTQIRDEAHRVAITFHRQRREKITKQSFLKSISGLGPKRRKLLMENFESLQGLQQASIEDLAQKGQLPLKLATALFDELQKLK